MRKGIKHLLYACLCATLIATPLAAQTVELSTRSFWLGERPNTIDSFSPFIALRRIDWIAEILEADPTLQRAVFHIEEVHVSVADFVAGPDEREILLGPDRLPSQFNLLDYQIYGPPVSTATSFTYIPVEPGAGYLVHCGQRDDIERMSLCVVYASYAADDRIRLKARLYFPPDPIDRPDYFRNVAKRMREVARCLDVTDEPDRTQTDSPTLSGCRLELTV